MKTNDKILEMRNKIEEELKEKAMVKLNNETVLTGSETCDACPYVVYGKYGERRCYYDTYNECVNETMSEE